MGVTNNNVSETATLWTCRCGHDEDTHRYEPGFYDVRGGHFDCMHVGCPCSRYEPRRADA